MDISRKARESCAVMVVQNAGVPMIALGCDINDTNNAKLWMGPELVPAGTNYTLKSDGTPLTTLNTPIELLITVPISGQITQMMGTQVIASSIINGSINSQNAQTVNTFTGYVRTTNNTPTLIYTVTLPSNSAALWTINCVGRDESSGTVGDSVAITQNSLVKNVAGTASLVTSGSATSFHDTSMSACALSYSASGATVSVSVAGISATVDWVVRITQTMC